MREVFAIPLGRAARIGSRQQRRRGWKPYSPHAPEVGCIAKGKARKPHEFGCKVSITTTNARSPGGQFVLHAKAFRGRPHDGHTPGCVPTGTRALTGIGIRRACDDKGHVGHNAPRPPRVHRSGQKRGVHGQIRKEPRRRAAIEPVIGHLKSEGHLGRNALKGRGGDHANAVLTAAGHNFRLILRWLRNLSRKIIAALDAQIWPRPALTPDC